MTLRAKNIIAPFSSAQLETICRIVADTSTGLTGSEIGRLLQESRIEDPDPSMTKWKRLFNAFITFQNRNQAGNHVLVFLGKCLDPARHLRNPDTFRSWIDDLNQVLSLCGMHIGNDGKARRAEKAHTLDDAIARASRLRSKLESRNAHSDVLTACKAELVADNYFHAAFESTKSISRRIRTMTGQDGDGADLVQRVFRIHEGNCATVSLSSLATETQRGEQRGFVNLVTGIFGTFRNPLAHASKIDWEMSEEDALDIMSVVSLVHRRLDKAIVGTPRSERQ